MPHASKFVSVLCLIQCAAVAGLTLNINPNTGTAPKFLLDSIRTFHGTLTGLQLDSMADQLSLQGKSYSKLKDGDAISKRSEFEAPTSAVLEMDGLLLERCTSTFMDSLAQAVESPSGTDLVISWFANLVYGSIYVSGDWLAQAQVNSVAILDSVGVLCVPLIHLYFHSSGQDPGISLHPGDFEKLWMIGLDQEVLTAAKAAFYLALVGLMRGLSKEQVSDSIISSSKVILKHGCIFWSLSQIVLMAPIPEMHYSVWGNFCEFVWGVILASSVARHNQMQTSGTGVSR